MYARRKTRRARSTSDPFARIERAADAAAEEVLEEDRLLRELGIDPPAGRSR